MASLQYKCVVEFKIDVVERPLGSLDVHFPDGSYTIKSIRSSATEEILGYTIEGLNLTYETVQEGFDAVVRNYIETFNDRRCRVLHYTAEENDEDE